jgi:hypothetical protein
MMRTTISTVFTHPDAQCAHQQWRRVVDGFRTRFPKLADLMDKAKEDVLAYASFPTELWQKTCSNNRLVTMPPTIPVAPLDYDLRLFLHGKIRHMADALVLHRGLG